MARRWPWEWSCCAQGQVSLTMPFLWLLTGVLRGGVGQHLLHQPDACPGEPLGRRAARDWLPRSLTLTLVLIFERHLPEEGVSPPWDPSHAPSQRGCTSRGTPSQTSSTCFREFLQL